MEEGEKERPLFDEVVLTFIPSEDLGIAQRHEVRISHMKHDAIKANIFTSSKT